MVSRPPLRASASGFNSLRSVVLALCHALALGISSVSGRPLQPFLPIIGALDHHDNVPEVKGPGAWGLYVASAVLVLLGGAFAGLTIALMGQDSIYLQVMAGDPNEPQSKNARRVYRLLQRGKHWVLVTLLLSNVIVNETLPVVLDRCLGGGVPAVIGSTVLIVIFGEVVPQSICVRYGLPIGGCMSGPVLLLMYLMGPIAWPIAKLLDWVLGEDHGTVYKKSGLKTLVGLHQSLGEAHERLNEDEVTIISAVLDLKSKQVGDVMTPMDDVFTMSEDTVLDEKTMDRILSEGYSRIPVHASGQPSNFIGMLLVKILITYDPEDSMLVKDFPLATLPETRPETSCLDIINFFQEGKSHMVLVSEFPGDNRGALGIVCLEDVIEELIGEEIIDESDVYIDVHKAIRRLAPAPKARTPRKDAKAHTLHQVEGAARNERLATFGGVGVGDGGPVSSSPRTTTFLIRRASAGPDGQISTPLTVKAHFDDIRDTLRHLGPSNPATNPRNTRSTAVKIKPGLGSVLGQIPPIVSNSVGDPLSRTHSVMSDTVIERMVQVPNDNEDAPLLKPLLSGKDGTHSVRRFYGTDGRSPTQSRLSVLHGTSPREEGLDSAHSPRPGSSSTIKPKTPDEGKTSSLTQDSTDSQHNADSADSPVSEQSSQPSSPLMGPRHGLTEDLVESGGIKKLVIRTASSDSTKDSNEHSPTPSATAPRHRTWSIMDRFGGGTGHDGDDASRVSRISSEPPETRSVGNVAELVENHQASEPVRPLIVVADESSPVEAPLAQAITEPIDEPLPEPPKPVDDHQSKEQPQSSAKQAQEPAPEPTPEPTPELESEPTPELESEPALVPAPVPEPAQPSEHRAKSSTPPFGKSISPLKRELVSSPDLSIKSPTDGLLEEEDMTSSTATLGAVSNAGSSNNNHKRRKKNQKKKRGKGTTF